MMTKRELFNAKNAGQKIEKGMTLTVVSTGQFADKDKDGNDVTVTALACKDGSIYTTISATIADSMDLLDDILSEEGEVTVKVNESKSNSGRSFYQLQII